MISPPFSNYGNKSVYMKRPSNLPTATLDVPSPPFPKLGTGFDDLQLFCNGERL
jgi:hypothetical protein